MQVTPSITKDMLYNQLNTLQLLIEGLGAAIQDTTCMNSDMRNMNPLLAQVTLDSHTLTNFNDAISNHVNNVNGTIPPSKSCEENVNAYINPDSEVVAHSLQSEIFNDNNNNFMSSLMETPTVALPRKKRCLSKPHNEEVGKVCQSCKTSKTPEWRKGPCGAKTLCNRCGLRYSRIMKRMAAVKKKLKCIIYLMKIPLLIH